MSRHEKRVKIWKDFTYTLNVVSGSEARVGILAEAVFDEFQGGTIIRVRGDLMIHTSPVNPAAGDLQEVRMAVALGPALDAQRQTLTSQAEGQWLWMSARYLGTQGGAFEAAHRDVTFDVKSKRLIRHGEMSLYFACRNRPVLGVARDIQCNATGRVLILGQ